MINLCINIIILNQNITILICRTSPIIDSIRFLQSTRIQSKPSLCLTFFVLFKKSVLLRCTSKYGRKYLLLLLFHCDFKPATIWDF